MLSISPRDTTYLAISNFSLPSLPVSPLSRLTFLPPPLTILTAAAIHRPNLITLFQIRPDLVSAAILEPGTAPLEPAPPPTCCSPSAAAHMPIVATTYALVVVATTHALHVVVHHRTVVEQIRELGGGGDGKGCTRVGPANTHAEATTNLQRGASLCSGTRL